MVRRPSWNHDQVALGNLDLLTTSNFWTAPFTRLNLFRRVKRSAQRKCGCSVEDVVNVVGGVMNFGSGGRRVVLMLDSNAQFHACPTNQLLDFIRRLQLLLKIRKRLCVHYYNVTDRVGGLLFGLRGGVQSDK